MACIINPVKIIQSIFSLSIQATHVNVKDLHLAF